MHSQIGTFQISEDTEQAMHKLRRNFLSEASQR